MAYFSWSLSGLNPNAPQFGSCSPNLAQLNHYISQKWGGHTLGCKVVRPIAGSDRWSTHAYGAAIDIRLPNEPARLYAVAFMMDNFDVLGLNAIHDYRRQMIFKDDHQWHTASIGSLGQDWWHVEVTPSAYGDGRPVEEKLGGPPPPPPPPPPGNPYGKWPHTPGKPTLSYGFGYTNGTQQYQEIVNYFNLVCLFEAGQNGNTGKPYNTPYTVFLDASIMSVRNLNAFFNKGGANQAQAVESWNGVCGPETWKVIDALAARHDA